MYLLDVEVTESNEKLKVVTAPMEFNDLLGSKAPLLEPLGLKSDFFFSSRNELDFRLGPFFGLPPIEPSAPIAPF